jgi:hypothetical protein
MSSLIQVTKKLHEKLDEHKADFSIADVWYSDQSRIPRYPAVCVQSDTQTDTLTGANRRVTQIITVLVLIYHGQVQPASENLIAADELTEAIKTFLNTDDDLEGMIVHGYVRSTESGQVARGNTPVRASRLTYEATAKENLP